MTEWPLHQRVSALSGDAASAATAAQRAYRRAGEVIADEPTDRGDLRRLNAEVTSELTGYPDWMTQPLMAILRQEPTDQQRLDRLAAEARRLRRVADAMWSAVQVCLGKAPATEVVSLRDAAAVLDIDVRAAESALRRGQVRSGYPLDQVEWLRDNRPGRGARTDLPDHPNHLAGDERPPPRVQTDPLR